MFSDDDADVVASLCHIVSLTIANRLHAGAHGSPEQSKLGLTPHK